ncbi:MAG: capsule assembly Wzi family protein, partial [Candidatus Omnitrophica bacterium]|nr:capsule assembly Wzi family protein [Candidatus Omnitrophota bacterium]
RSKDEFSTTEIKRTDTDQLASLDLKFVMPLRPELRIASGLEVYGEWAGEDRFSFWENESPGFLAGLFLADFFKDKGTDFRVEYAKNKPAWYNHGLYNALGTATAYTYEGEIIGHHMGGDADDLFFRVSKELPFLSTPYFDAVKAGVQLDIERHGLSQAMQEKKIEFAADFLWSHSDRVAFSLRYEVENYRNFDYIAGKTARNHIFWAELNLKF